MKKLIPFALSFCLLPVAQAADPLPSIADKMRQCMKLPAGTDPAFQCRKELDVMIRQARSAPAASPAVPAPAPSAPAGPAAPGVTVGAAMKSLPAAEQRQFQSSIGAAGGVQIKDIKGMDLETAMMAVQSNRANLLETQLKGQIESVQEKNAQIARLNQALASLNAIAAGLKSDAKTGDRLPPNEPLWKEANGYLAKAGVTSFGTAGVGAATTKGQLGTAIQQIKAQIDSMNNSQQMDMLRLQSLSNKRNEAFEVMTNFIKKMQESRSSIIGNMR